MPNQVELCKLITAWLNDPDQRTDLPDSLPDAEHKATAFIDQPTPGQLYFVVAPGLRGAERQTRQGWEKGGAVTVAIVEKLNERTVEGRDDRIDELSVLHEDLENLLLGESFEAPDGTTYDRDEEVGDVTPALVGGELYEDNVFNAEIPIQFTWTLKKPSVR